MSSITSKIMKQPPRDTTTEQVIPHDHDEILNTDFVIRRISEIHHVVKDTDGNKRVSSMAFKPSSDENGSMSVDIEKLISNDGIDPKEFVTCPKYVGSVKILVGHLRKLNCIVGYDPIPIKNPYHGGVWGNRTRSIQKQIQADSEWYVQINDVSL